MQTFTKRKSLTKATPKPSLQADQRAIVARRLDRLADHHLHLGFHVQAEHLAKQAAELRGRA